MAYVMTTAGSIGCAHAGTVALASSAKLTVRGNPVLLETDVPAWALTGCTQTSSSQTPCASFLQFTGKASKLTVGGAAVLLDTFSGVTNGVPDTSSAPASAGQTILEAS